jgi:D-alanyl-D-alanine dipeptidase
VLVLSNNPFKTESPARFEDINKDGSIMMMMSGHNPGFVPASANFDSYNTTVTISEKQSVVVTDQKPQSEPTASLAQQDAKPIPPEVPVTGSIPVSNPVPPTIKTDKKLDEEELPEREDLEEINVQVEYSDEPPVTEAAANIPVVSESKAQSNYNLLIEKIYNPIKNHFKGVSIPITSGYRSPDKNVITKGVTNSQHTRGEAIDIDMGSGKSLKVKNSDIFNYIKNNLNFDQLIWEFGTSTEPDWVHVSYSSSGRQRKDIKKAVKVNGKTQYTPYA